MTDLSYRRQFILSNKEPDINKNWKRIKLRRNRDNFTLYMHPDLLFEHAVNDRFELVLLGYILDPYKPENSSSEVLASLLGLNDFESILSVSNSLSGRFAIVYNNHDTLQVFNDATGLREVYYYHGSDTIACGSTSKILADYFNIPKDEGKEIVKFYNSKELNDRERRWIGTNSIYKNVYHVLPNHYLDLITGKTHRFWPTDPRKEITLQEATRVISPILSGTFDAAVRRFTLHQGLTGGWDTRLLLAATRNYVDNIQFYFIRGFKADVNLPNSGDYTIAKAIAEKHNIKLDIVLLGNEELDTEFEKIYYQNNDMSRPKLFRVYYDAFQKKLDNTVTVAGTGSNEILRLMSGLNRNISDAKKIAGLFGYQNYSYVIESVNTWLNESLPLKSLNYKLIDLFNWEQFFGNWGSLSVSEQDIVREELRPFNNRLLISTYISLNDKHRYRDYPLGHVHIINHLWPELMDFEIDMKRIRLKKLLRFFGMEILADKTLQRLRMLT